MREKLRGEGRPLSSTVPLKRRVLVFRRPLLFSEKAAVSRGASSTLLRKFSAMSRASSWPAAGKAGGNSRSRRLAPVSLKL